MLPEAAVVAVANELHDREGYTIALADAPEHRKAYFCTLAREVLAAAAPHFIAMTAHAIADGMKAWAGEAERGYVDGFAAGADEKAAA